MVKKVYQFFKDDETLDEAASLSFYTLFAIVPTLLIALTAFTKVEVFEVFLERINNFLIANLLPINQQAFSEYLNEFIENSSKTGVMGVVFVIVTSIFFFMDYEYIINKIYNTKIRSYIRSILTYFVLTIFFPVMLIVTFYISDEFEFLVSNYTIFGELDTKIFMGFAVIWGLFFVSYMISPNKDMNIKAVFYASLFGSILWTLAKSLFVYYAFYNTNYVSLYGQISILMLFMLWIFVHWVIFIYGLKFCKYLEDKIFI